MGDGKGRRRSTTHKLIHRHWDAILGTRRFCSNISASNYTNKVVRHDLKRNWQSTELGTVLISKELRTNETKQLPLQNNNRSMNSAFTNTLFCMGATYLLNYQVDQMPIIPAFSTWILLLSTVMVASPLHALSVVSHTESLACSHKSSLCFFWWFVDTKFGGNIWGLFAICSIIFWVV